MMTTGSGDHKSEEAVSKDEPSGAIKQRKKSTSILEEDILDEKAESKDGKASKEDQISEVEKVANEENASKDAKDSKEAQTETENQDGEAEPCTKASFLQQTVVFAVLFLFMAVINKVMANLFLHYFKPETDPDVVHGVESMEPPKEKWMPVENEWNEFDIPI